MVYLLLAAGVFKGWALGSNDAAKVFGTAVATRVLTHKTAVILLSIFVILGSYFGGAANINKMNSLATNNGVIADNVLDSALKAFIIYTSAALCVAILTYLRLSVSSNQATTGAIIGWGIVYAEDMSKNIPEILKFASTWVASPILAGITAFTLVKLSDKFLVPKISKLGCYDMIVKVGYLVAGSTSAYILGANSSAGVTSLYYGPNGLIPTPELTALIGGISIAFGALTYSKKVMGTVGSGIVVVTPINGFLVVLSAALVLFIFSSKKIGINIPVSTSQAVVGALTGVGLTRGYKTINFKTLKKIGIAWVTSPTAAGLITFTVGTLTKGYFTR